MFFDSHFWPATISLAAVSAFIAFCLIARTEFSNHWLTFKSPFKVLLHKVVPLSWKATILTFLVELVVQRLLICSLLPPLCGSFGGHFGGMLLAWAGADLMTGVFFSRSGPEFWPWSHLVLVLILYWGLGQQFFYRIDSKALSSAVTVKTGPKLTDLAYSVVTPPTLSKARAKELARELLETNHRYRSLLDVGNIQLQTIKHHRYYVALLEPIDTGDKFWTPLFGGRVASPGYIVVDAENESATPQLHDGFQITLFENIPFAMNLEKIRVSGRL